MFPSFIITFREFIEIAIIISVVLASTNGLPNRYRLVFCGILFGITGSCIIALFTDVISNFAEGFGQELFNAMILMAAAFTIGWTVIWMKSHGQKIVTELKHKGQEVVAGNLPRVVLPATIGLATFREGSEIVLFSYGLILGGESMSNVLLGSIGGSIAGTVVGVAMYMGLIKISPKYIFQVTTTMLVLLTAGMMSMATKYLVSAGYFEKTSFVLWDSSFILSDESFIGEFFGILIGYTAQPMLIQAIVYVLTIGIICAIMYKSSKNVAHTTSRSENKHA